MSMSNCPSNITLTIPREYRKVAEALFPQEGLPKQMPDAAAHFAQILGVGAEYQRLLGIQQDSIQMKEFLGHFQNNLDLLIQKTWVEKADMVRKEKLQDEIPPLISLIVNSDFRQALDRFGAILEGLAYLFFGKQSTKDDFNEYTFRIDDQIGLFWWYGSQLNILKKTGRNEMLQDESVRAVLLIGICYLTNF